MGGGKAAGREGGPRMLRATSGEVMSAMTRLRAPQGHAKTSKPQVRRKSPAQSRRGAGGGAFVLEGDDDDGPGGDVGGGCCCTGRGTTLERWRELGAKTPKNLVRWTLGFTTSATRRLSNCTGVITSVVAPPGRGFLSR